MEQVTDMIKFYLKYNDNKYDENDRNSILENNVPGARRDHERKDRLRFFSALNNYLTWRAIMPYIGYLDKGRK